MLFNSYVFVLAFFPLCLIGYFGLNHFKKYTLAQFYLLCMSLWFYGYFLPSYLVIMSFSIVGNYLFTKIMDKTSDPRLKKAEVTLAVLANLAVLFFFKYYDFCVENLNHFANTDFPLLSVVMPLGISFFTFQQVSYVIDSYHGEVKQYPFLQYATFVVYFPQLIAGPIVTHDELIPQFLDLSKKKFNWDYFAQGLYMFVLGMAKKVLIADTFGIASNWGFGNIALLDTTNAWLVSLAYTIQIYFDFSGYCDMAIGLGKMMNFELPINFDSPYKAKTIVEFWQRWHKTLTRFFTKYIYIPLGGNRKGTVRTYLNILIVFLASGIWHGANWTFFLWGILHGVFNIITRWGKRFFERIPGVLNWLITFCFVNLTWVLFRADSITDAVQFIQQMFSANWGPVHESLINAFLLTEFDFVFGPIPFFDFLDTWPVIWPITFYLAAMVLILFARNAREHMLNFKPSIQNLILIYVLLIWCLLSFSGVSTFLYFNF